MRHLLTTLVISLVLVLAACADDGTAIGSGPSPAPVSEVPADDPTAGPSDPPLAAPIRPTATDGVSGEEALADLEAARQAWAALALRDYTYRLTRLCFCPPVIVGPTDITVAGGSVAEAVVVEDGSPAEQPLTVDELHDQIEAAITEGAIVQGGYDGDGLPAELYVDAIPDAIDDEVTYTATLSPDAGVGAAGGGAAGGAAGGGIQLDVVSQAIVLASGSPELQPTFGPTTAVCGPTDAFLGKRVTATVGVADSAQDRIAAWTAEGFTLAEVDDRTVATGTIDGAPVTFTIVPDAAEVPTIDLTVETTTGFDVTGIGAPPIENACG